LLDWFGNRFGTMTSEVVVLTFGEKPLTHQQLADIVGMTRVTVTKALSQFRQAGLIAAQSRWVPPAEDSFLGTLGVALMECDLRRIHPEVALHTWHSGERLGVVGDLGGLLTQPMRRATT
jgi:DNA-binding transcriptional MocR family regulator